MDIEYQKKEVTWCLDRDGPRICLRAVAINGNLKSLEISSERFQIMFENNEARDFLSILKTIVEEKSVSKSALFQEIKTDQVKNIGIQEIPESISQESSIIEEAPKLDTSEILNVLKQSESSTEDLETPLLDLLKDQKDLNLGLNDKAVIPDEIPEISSGISVEENVKPSDLFKESIDTASFFREDVSDEISEEKTPLEQLLEEDNKNEISPITPQDTIITSVHEENIPRRTIPKEKPGITPFTPDDLSSDAFISDFNSKKVEEVETPSTMDETPDISSPVEDESGKAELMEGRKYLSFEERRREIEKEREARKKRLWELTRGF